MIDAAKQPGIRVAQIFLESASFNHRPDFLEYPPDSTVSAELDIELESGVSDDGNRARVRIGVATRDDGDALYRFSFVMTALLEAEEQGANFPLSQYVRTNAWALLTPFVREVIANVTSRGRFGPIWLKPMNLLALANESENKPATASS